MRFFPWLIGCLLLAGCNLADTTSQTIVPAANTGESKLVVAWVEAGNLLVWQQGEAFPRRVASGGVIHPYIAPDGEQVAFTRGPNGAPDSLWLVDIHGTAEQKLVGDGSPPRYQEGQMQIGDVVWYDDTILYLNTLRRETPAYQPVNELYRANTRTREVALLLNPGEGGRISISPDKQQIAVVYPGTYGRQDGRIRVVDPLAQDAPRDLLYFIGVATGSHLAYYPEIHWLPDSSAVLAAIPDADLIYSDTATAEDVPLTRLWRLPVANPSDRELIGSVRASFFGLPRWSDDGTMMTYLERQPGTNDFTVVVADAQGENGTPYLSGAAGSIEQPTWIPDSTRFFYTLDNAGAVYYGARDMEMQPLSSEVVFVPQFVSRDLYVFATPAAVAADGVQMRYALMGGVSQPIGSTPKIPIFNAVLTNSGYINSNN